MRTNLVLRRIELKVGAFRLAVDLDLQVGCLGVFGPSGSGKTMLLELIAGLRRHRTGQIEVAGKQLADPAKGIWVPVHRRRIGYVPQDLALFPHLNVRANIRYGAPKDAAQAKKTDSAIEAICEILELEPFFDRRPESLSGGEKQRVAIARALVAAPRLLLLDEPLTGLDQDRKDTVLAYLQLLRQRWAVPMIYVSHQAEELAALCDEIVVIREGAIIAQGEPRDVFEISNRPAYRLRPELGTSPE